MAIESTNMLSTYNQVLVERTTELLIGRTIAGLVLANSFADMGKRVGNTITYHRAPKGVVQDASEGSGNTKTYSTAVGSTDSLTLDYFKEVPFEANDLDQNVIGNKTMAIESYADSGAKQLAKQIDSDILEDIFDDAGIVDNTQIGTDGVAVNDATFREVRKTLTKLGVDPSDIVILLSTDDSAEALGIDVFKSSDYVDTMPQINGKLPKSIYGMSVYMDAVNLPTLTASDSVSGSSTTNVLSLAMHKDAVKFVSTPLYEPNTSNADFKTSEIKGLSLRTKSWHEPEVNTSRLVIDALYGVKLLKHATVQGDDNSMVVPIVGGVS